MSADATGTSLYLSNQQNFIYKP